MQIVCPNCATAYEIPDAVFGGRARKLRCEHCGTQWRAGPPEGELAEIAVPPPVNLPPEPPAASSDAGRTFGKPIDANAQAEFRQAMERERQAPAIAPAPAPIPPPAAAPEPVAAQPASFAASLAGGDATAEPEDPFINLVMAARSRAIEFEPDAPPAKRKIVSSPAFIGALLTLFVISVGFLLFHAR
jgi:predicted Zn finger-like uncharacterized protein